MQKEAPDSTNPVFRLKVAGTGLALSALLGALHGQAVSQAEANKAHPPRLMASALPHQEMAGGLEPGNAGR